MPAPKPVSIPPLEPAKSVDQRAQAQAEAPPTAGVAPAAGIAPAASVAPAEPAPVSASAALATALGRTGSRQAARVSVAFSTSKAGVFEVRLLAEGEVPRSGSSEALLILIEPTALSQR